MWRDGGCGLRRFVRQGEVVLTAGEKNFVHFCEGQLCVVDGGGGFWDAPLSCFQSSSGLRGMGL